MIISNDVQAIFKAETRSLRELLKLIQDCDNGLANSNIKITEIKNFCKNNLTTLSNENIVKESSLIPAKDLDTAIKQRIKLASLIEKLIKNPSPNCVIKILKVNDLPKYLHMTDNF